jgi:hypothetical protein
MFESLEKRGTSLCIGIVAGIIVLGRTFGASYWGLFPLAFCIASGVWLWVQEVIRSGREMEWSSEKLRGQVVSLLTGYDSPDADECYSGDSEFDTGIR